MRNIFIVVSAVLLLGILGFTIYKIARFLRKKLDVVLVDFAVGFLGAALVFESGFRKLFQFLSSAFNATYDLFASSEAYQTIKIENFVSDFVSNEGLLKVLLLITFILLGSYISSLIRIKYHIGGKDKNIDDQVYEKRDVLLKNIVTSIIVILSIYLCISALIAVSYFNDSKLAKDDVVETLHAEFEKYRASDELKKTYYLTTIENIQHEIEKDTLFKEKLGLSIYTQNVINNIEQQYDRLEQEQNNALNFLDEVNQKKVSNDYKLNYRNEIITWYYNFRNNWKNYVNNDFQSYLIITNKWIQLEQAKTDTNYFSDQLQMNYNYPLLKEFDRENKFVKKDVFNFIAGWLVSSMSYQFIIIAGLIGFGFLGAAVSTLIRERKDEEEDPELLLTDLLGVIIRGFTAALIIFLAVKGGLSVLVRDAVELNAYALFFTCFASAVYSENAWAWAKKKLITDLDSYNEPKNSEKDNAIQRKKSLDPTTAFNRIDQKMPQHSATDLKEKATSIFEKIDKKMK